MIKTKVKANIRSMIRRDLPELIEMERLNFDEEAMTENDFINYLRLRDRMEAIAEIEDKVVGYLVYQLFSNKYKIVSLVIHPKFHRNGIGTQFVEKLKAKIGGKQKRNRIVLEIIETNLNALLFFKANGFKAIKVIRGFFDNGVDSIRMRFVSPKD